jgi:hypothetical protein
MSDKFQVLDCKDDVLSFSKPEQTFKLGNFIERTRKQFENKIYDYSTNEGFGFISIEGKKFIQVTLNGNQCL